MPPLISPPHALFRNLEPSHCDFPHYYVTVCHGRVAAFYGNVDAHAVPMHSHGAMQVTIMPCEHAGAIVTWLGDDGAGRTLQVRGPHVLFVEKNVSHAMRWCERGIMIHLYLSDEYTSRYIPENFHCGVLLADWHELSRRDAFLHDLAAAVSDFCLHPRDEHAHYLDGLGSVIASHVLRAAFSPKPRPVRPSLHPLTLHRVLRHIEESFQDPIAVPDLAKIAGLKPSYFAHLFATSTGTSPHQYLMKRRVRHAQALMREKKFNMAEIAAASGFSDQSHLRKSLRRFSQNNAL